MAEPSWRAGAPDRRCGRAIPFAFAADRRRLRVGLVNNMPDAALLATERQFQTLLELAVPERPVELQLFHAPALIRSGQGAARVAACYRPVAEVEQAELDALVVTGAEPRASDLRDEPFWPALARLADWATSAELPSLWSCLAAHVAVLRLDGVARRRLPAKHSGLFACLPAASGDPLLRGRDGPALAPHSRTGDLDGAELAARGYTVLTRSPEVGVDSFVRRRAFGRAMLFLQGHPEYEPGSLALEFKRDLGRYLEGARDRLPGLPAGVFGAATAARLQTLLDDARGDRRPELMARWPLPSEITLAADTWRAPAARLLRNWLEARQDRAVGTCAVRLTA
jgi:homoserine O-succinyltransferase/O-acetyltransferase